MVQLQEQDVGVEIKPTLEFPVVLYNGECQVNVGNIEINPTINFQKFRIILKQMTGISYNNLTTYLVETHSEDNRKTLITSKVNFMGLVKEISDAYFLVVLKRSRRDRRRKNNNRFGVDLSPADLFDYSYEHHESKPYVPECGKAEFWLHELEMQKANRMNFVMQDSNCDVDFDSDVNANFPTVKEAYPVDERLTSRAACQECTQAIKRGSKPPLFHLCVYDDVVDGFFRSTAGPISRPCTVK